MPVIDGLPVPVLTQIPAVSQRSAFAEQVRAALAPHDRFCERVHVAILAGTR